MNDTYTGIIYFKSSPPAAEFKYDSPVFEARESHGGYTNWVMKTHFRLNLDNLQSRIKNLKLPKNGAPHDLSQEFKALAFLIPDHNLHVH